MFFIDGLPARIDNDPTTISLHAPGGFEADFHHEAFCAKEETAITVDVLPHRRGDQRIATLLAQMAQISSEEHCYAARRNFPTNRNRC
jgi:hypothetical protein